MILINTAAPHSVARCGENDILINFIISREYLNAAFFERIGRDNYLSQFFIEALNNQADHNNYLVYDTNKKLFCPIIADPTGFGTLTSYLNKKSAVSSVEIPIYEYLTPLFSTYFRNPEFQYKRNYL